MLLKYRNKELYIILGAAILFVIFINPFTFYFLNDDFNNLNKYSSGNFFTDAGMRLTQEASIKLDILFYYKKAWGYVFTNCIIHLCTCAVGWLWLKKISASLAIIVHQNIYLAVYLLFMWYAFHTEPIVWVICRTASLSLLFFLISWTCILKGIKYNFFNWLSLPCFIIGLLAYENCWLYPLSISIWWFLLNKESVYKTKKTITVIFLSWLVLIAYFPIRKFIATQWIGDYLSGNIVTFNINAYAKNGVALIARSFLPPMENKLFFILCTVGISIALLTMAFYLYRRKKTNKLWWLLLFIWISSYLFFVTLGVDTNGYEAERYIYFPSFFLCAWLVYSISLVSLKKPVPQILFALFLSYHIFFLNTSLQAFRNAGNVAKATILAIQKNKTSKKIYLENVPAKAFGVPIFRYGFNSAVNWVYPNEDTSRITIVSEHQYNMNENICFIDSIDKNLSVYKIRFYVAPLKLK